jgi:hypothetical protein
MPIGEGVDSDSESNGSIFSSAYEDEFESDDSDYQSGSERGEDEGWNDIVATEKSRKEAKLTSK